MSNTAEPNIEQVATDLVLAVLHGSYDTVRDLLDTLTPEDQVTLYNTYRFLAEQISRRVRSDSDDDG